MPGRYLEIEGARQNNLKNIDLSLPPDRVVVVTGVSGSGKSSLAFDTIFAEGQWRFIESLSSYARLFLEKIDRPEVEAIRNIRPAIALEQRNTTRSSRSTVGTASELYDYFRLLYAAVARPRCPGCGRDLKRWNVSDVVEHLVANRAGRRARVCFRSDAGQIELLRRRGFHRFEQNGREPGAEPEAGPVAVVVDRLVLGPEARERLADSLETAWREGGGSVSVDLLDGGVEDFSERLYCESCERSVPEPVPLLFSFQHPTGACPTCNGFGNILDYDPVRVIPDPERSLAENAVEPWSKPSHRSGYLEFLRQATAAGIDIQKPFGRLSRAERTMVFDGNDDFYGIRDFFADLESKRYKLHVRVFLSRYRTAFPCTACNGGRLRPEALAYRLAGRNLADLSRLSFSDLDRWQRALSLAAGEAERAAEPLRLIRAKLDILRRLGLDYLTMTRQTRTLSGGEAQRIQLGNQLAARLTGTLYVLDEPTVGLHHRDTDRIAGILRDIARMGNSVLVVEHDRSIIEKADWVVDMGPGGGREGGRVLYSGPADAFPSADTLTARYLRHDAAIAVPHRRRDVSASRRLELRGATGHNLHDLTLSVPLGALVCVTGVSGSGKSTLVSDTLYPAVARVLRSAFVPGEPYDGLSGTEGLTAVQLIDQSPIGRTPRSNPATYLDVFNAIRRVFAAQPEARRLGLTAGAFSFNVAGGRCEACGGDGFQRLEMYFFEDLYVTCDACKGRRYRDEVLYVSYLGRDIHQVLEMTVAEAMRHFAEVPAVLRRLRPMEEMGLGYLRLGQPAPTLSGGEAQRLKICAELGKARRGETLYILDEPTTGLHFDDIRRFLKILQRLVDEGHTVLVIEHQLDVIKTADWVIDLGPEAGEAGGRIVAAGPPERIAEVPASLTGRALADLLAR